MQVQSKKITGKYSQTQKGAFLEPFRHYETKKNEFFVIPPFMVYSNFPLWLTQIFAPDKWAAPILSCSKLVMT